MQKILIVNVNWLGDVVLSTPFIRTIRKEFTNAHIACVLEPRCKQILENNPYIDEVILYDEKGLHHGLFGKLKFIFLLKNKKFDTVYLLHRSLTKTLLTFLAGIKTRIGYSTKKRSIFLTKKIIPPDINNIHRADYFLELAYRAGVKYRDNLGCDIHTNGHDKEAAQNLLKENGISIKAPFIVINPAGNWANKRWPAEYFARLCDLIAKDTNIKVVLLAADKDIKLANEIVSSSRNNINIVNLAGKCSLGISISIIELSNLVITNDTGPMHIASALGKNIVCLFGPTSPLITGPYKNTAKTMIIQSNVHCKIPCYKTSCEKPLCMENIRPQEVYQKVKELVGV